MIKPTLRPRILSSLALLALLASCGGARETKTAVHTDAPVIIISIDTLRADHLPAYGYTGVRTPAVDAFRRDSMLFTNAYSHCPMTLPSHVSILTGLLPHQNGVRNNLGYAYDSSAHPGIMQSLKARGYETGAAVSAYVLRSATGLGPAFDFYDDELVTKTNVGIGELSRPGTSTAAAAESWIEGRKDKPFFLLLHLFEPHAPYEAPEPFRSEYASLPYDGEIAASDAIVGSFIAKLKALGIYDRALIILLSDHGEGLGDHGESEHGVFLYREVIHVPLMVKLPKGERANTTSDAVVQLADVAPTIAAVTGASVPKDATGVSLVDAGALGARRVYSETMLPRLHFGWSDLGSAIDATHHYIRAPKAELYDLAADPGEKKNVISDQRRVYSDMRQYVESLKAEYKPPAIVSGEEAEKLAALGYIGQVRDAGGDLPDPKDRIGDLDLMKQASAMEKSGDFRGALAEYKAMLDRNPRFVDAWVRTAAVHERLGNNEDAIAAYRRAIETTPALSAGFALSLGSLYLRVRDLPQAEAHAKLAMDRSPGGAHILLSRIALARGDLTAAAREAQAAGSDSTRKHDAAVVLARVLSASGKLAEALEVLDRTQRELTAAGLEPVEDLEGTRADVLARMNRTAEAEKAFRAEIERYPANRRAYTSYAILLVTQGRKADAERVLEALLRANPGRSSALLAAEMWTIVGDQAAAKRWSARGGK
jgi:arylsulfatase A-like enzyme/Tfp pilus assembly protein PilF